MTITFCLHFESYHATQYFKNIITVDHDIEGWNIWANSGPRKEIFLKNWLLSLLSI